MCILASDLMRCLYGLAQNEHIEKVLNFEIHVYRSGLKTLNFEMRIIC